jgi:hypothetical protein
MNRNRLYYIILVIITIIVGLAARRFSNYLPDIINLGLGDALWALMIYWIIGLLFPKFDILKAALISLSLCFLVEFSQLYQADWINAIRSNTFGRLILGRGFLWSDFIAYSIGIAAGIGIEFLSKK